MSRKLSRRLGLLRGSAEGDSATPALIASVLLGGLALLLGYLRLGAVDTDSWSELITHFTAERITEGRHAFGITGYTHNPNGAAYILVPAYLLGLRDMASMRVVPLGFSALCVFVCSLALSGRASRPVRAWIWLSLALLIVQPAFLDWQGALQEQSFAMSFVLLSLAAAFGAPRSGTALFWIGFGTGWVGLDFLPGTVIFVWFARFSSVAAGDHADLAPAIRSATINATALALGVALALLMHLGQNVLYFDDLEVALRDIFGSVAARGSFSRAQTLNPLYAEITRAGEVGLSASQRLYSPIYREMTKAFFGAGWVHEWAVWSFGAALSVLSLMLLSRTSAPARKIAVLVLSVAGACFASLVWLFVMPNHGWIHFHFLPRHYLMGYLLLACIPLALSDRTRRLSPIDPALVSSWSLTSVLSPIGLAIAAFLAFNLDSSEERRLAAIHTELVPFASANDAQGSNIDAPKRRYVLGATYPQGWPGHSEHYWSSGDVPLPQEYGYTFPRPLDVSEVFLRFWDETTENGTRTPARYRIEARNGEQWTVMARYNVNEPASELLSRYHERFLVHRWRLREAVGATAIRIVFEANVSGDRGAVLNQMNIVASVLGADP